MEIEEILLERKEIYPNLENDEIQQALLMIQEVLGDRQELRRILEEIEELKDKAQQLADDLYQKAVLARQAIEKCRATS